MTKPLCSVVVCTRNRPQYLKRSLDAIGRLDHPHFEVIVVDNTRGDPAVKRIVDDSRARYIAEPSVGLSRARNVGASAARGNVVAFIDDDALPEEGWLRLHAEALEDPLLSATTGRVVGMIGGHPSAGAWGSVIGQDLGGGAFRVSRSTPEWFERANFGGIGTGTNMAFRRSLFQTGWGFRESLGLGQINAVLGEEHYAFFSLIRNGHEIAYVPDAVVRHPVPISTSDIERRKRRIIRASAAYLLMLLVEEPEFRRLTLRYLWSARRGERRAWRAGSPEPFVDRGTLVLAALTAPMLYLRTRLRNPTARERARPCQRER